MTKHTRQVLLSAGYINERSRLRQIQAFVGAQQCCAPTVYWGVLHSNKKCYIWVYTFSQNTSYYCANTNTMNGIFQFIKVSPHLLISINNKSAIADLG
ncbi:hypothetical protein [Nostoc sp.]|uniref:hypothetical protein n=1 Tax=Nostoc sp. TaxID=1180 RepID=UPI002FF7F9EA